MSAVQPRYLYSRDVNQFYVGIPSVRSVALLSCYRGGRFAKK